MHDPTPEQLAYGWNHVARRYGEHIDPFTALFAADAVDLAVVGPEDRVLDVASGFGAVTLFAARRARSVVAVDFSTEMCAALRERCEDAGVHNVEVNEMDAQSLDLPDDGFDVALSSFGVMMCPDRAAAFSEMARVTRPGGRLAASSWQAPPHNDWMELFAATITTAMPGAEPPTPPSFMDLADPDRFRAEVEAAGWSEVEIVDTSHRAPWADTDAAWAAIATSNPVFGPMLDRLPRDATQRMRDVFDERCAERGGAHLLAGAWIARGRA